MFSVNGRWFHGKVREEDRTKKSLCGTEGFFAFRSTIQLVRFSIGRSFLPLFLLLIFRRFLRNFFLCRSRPVVEIMGDVMAIRAFREFRHECCGMRDFVAALASRDKLVFAGVAVCAGQFLVLGIARAQQIQGFLVACRAILAGNIRAVSHDSRFVSLVAFFAVRLGHLG